MSRAVDWFHLYWPWPSAARLRAQEQACAQDRHWWVGALDWLEANPDRYAALEAWEREYLIGTGEYATSDWPGWEEAPMGPCPWRRRP